MQILFLVRTAPTWVTLRYVGSLPVSGPQRHSLLPFLRYSEIPHIGSAMHTFEMELGGTMQKLRNNR